ncbi:MAG: adenylate/guanylate cyclase domain-containing protein [Deltaproteobacteria bacterium]|nr:adenylate/guanylate cyclase domain-containing protein [Deltaproteobacteria bacterium]
MSDAFAENWSPDKKILPRTSISRQLLEDCIKRKILSKPILRESKPDETSGIQDRKKNWYFPEGAVERIKTIKRWKDEGYSMDEIAQKFKKDSAVFEIFPEKRSEIDVSDPDKDLDIPSDSGIPRTTISGSPLTLTIDNIDAPAYLINHSFEIEWINGDAEERVFKNNVSAISKLDSRNIFKLLFGWECHQYLRNWEEVIAFHMRFFKGNYHRDHISSIYSGITESEVRFLTGKFDEEDAFQKETINNFPLNFILQDGTVISYRVYTMFFREGLFFIYLPSERVDDDIMDFLSQRKKIINELLAQRMPSLVSLCVLVADLQDSVKISAELMSEEYFELINQLWKTLGPSFEKYHGIHGKHVGDGMLYYFIQKPGRNYISDAVNCSLEIREKMIQLSSEWKIRKGWRNELYLNIGINEGQEFFGSIKSAGNIEFTALGDSINYAGRLSDFARYGAIWATKNIISKITPEDMQKVSFGVQRQEHDRKIFMQNSFSRILDMLDEKNRNYSKFRDIATLPIAEIFRS